MKEINFNLENYSDKNIVPESIIQDNSDNKSAKTISLFTPEELHEALKLDFHKFVKEVDENSINFLINLANIDSEDGGILLKLDINDKTIPAKYRLVKFWIDEANKLQEQTDKYYPLPTEVSQSNGEKYQKYLHYLKKVKNQRKKSPVVQKAFDNVCSRMIRYNVSMNRFTFDDDTVVVWTSLKKLMKEVLSLRKKPFYDGTLQNNLKNIDYDHIIDEICLKNIYYPQQHWAQNLPAWDGSDRYRLLADTLHLDVESSEFKIVLTWFKGTMNRYLVPGNKNDNVLVIHGRQGRGKSTFFKKVSFSHTSGFGTSDKDDLLRYHKYALIEFEELDGLTKKTDVTAIKKFFSSDQDDIRPPYGRESILLERAFSCCGSVNTGNFLKDSTGNRRFITISVGSKYIDSSWLDDENEKNQFWAQVKEDGGLLGYIPRELEEVQMRMNESFVHEDTETEALVEFFEGLTEEEKAKGYFMWKPESPSARECKYPLTKYHIAHKVFGVEAIARPSQRAEKVIGGKIHNVLVNKLGFKYGNKRIDGVGHKKVYFLDE
ncbi:MAG: VapE family protein [Pleurocapsa sp. MO_192.B19]|nr:VapE family protein [Pleurocapsa sp. MO_192.B19]